MHTSTSILIKIDRTLYEYLPLCGSFNAYKCTGTKNTFFHAQQFKCLPERKKNSLERAVAFSLCSVPLQKGTTINSQTSVRY